MCGGGNLMKAAVLEEVGKLRLKDVPVPQPKNNEVLIRVRVCGICGTDIKLYKGDYTANVPVILGHEFSGEIVEIGKEVKDLKVGDRVVVDPNEPCGKCYWCRSGKSTFCKNMPAYGVLSNGAFAEYIVVGEKGTYKIPDALDYEKASFCEPVSCAIHGIDRAMIKPGETVTIIGGGQMGQILLQLAKNAGASKLIMITRSQWKLDLAKSFGATHLISAKKENVTESIMDITNGLGCDVVIEAVGSPRTVEQAFNLAKKSGRVVIFGFSPEKEKATFVPFDLLSKELSILGSWVNPYTFSRAIEIIASHQINLDPIISKKLNLDEIMEGFKLMMEKPEGFMKALVKL